MIHTFRARSALGMPFVWSDPESPSRRLVVPTATTQFADSPETAAELAAVPGIEVDAAGVPDFEPFVAAARARRAAREAEAAARHGEATFFPATLFVRARRKVEVSFSQDVHTLSSDWRAYEMAPERFTQLRFHHEIEIDFLDLAHRPPLTHVTLRCRNLVPLGTGRSSAPSCQAFGRAFTPAPQHIELYPWEARPIHAGDHATLVFVDRTKPLAYGTDMRLPDAPEPVAPRRSKVKLVARHARVDLSLVDDATLVPRQVVVVAATPAQPDADSDETRAAHVVAWAASREAQAEAIARGGLTMREILSRALSLGPNDASRSLEMRLARALDTAGWEHMPQCVRDGERVRPYRPRPALTA